MQMLRAVICLCVTFVRILKEVIGLFGEAEGVTTHAMISESRHQMTMLF